MFNIFFKVSLFCFFVFLITTSDLSAQVVGGGTLQKPVASQLGGLVSANIFKRLPTGSPGKKLKTTAPKTNTKTIPPTKTNKGPQTTPRTRVQTIDPPISEPNYSLTFQPVPNAGIDRELVATLTENYTEKQALLEIFRVSKTVYETEVGKKGKKNDIAMALTFFIATCVTVYKDAPEPSEAALDNLYDSLSELMLQEGAIVNSSNIDKQILHDRLIYISGLVLGGYTAAKQGNDSNSLMTFRLLAGVCLKSLMQLEPDNLSFDQNGLVVKK